MSDEGINFQDEGELKETAKELTKEMTKGLDEDVKEQVGEIVKESLGLTDIPASLKDFPDNREGTYPLPRELIDFEREGVDSFSKAVLRTGRIREQLSYNDRRDKTPALSCDLPSIDPDDILTFRRNEHMRNHGCNEAHIDMTELAMAAHKTIHALAKWGNRPYEINYDDLKDASNALKRVRDHLAKRKDEAISAYHDDDAEKECMKEIARRLKHMTESEKAILIHTGSRPRPTKADMPDSIRKVLINVPAGFTEEHGREMHEKGWMYIVEYEVDKQRYNHFEVIKIEGQKYSNLSECTKIEKNAFDFFDKELVKAGYGRAFISNLWERRYYCPNPYKYKQFDTHKVVEYRDKSGMKTAIIFKSLDAGRTWENVYENRHDDTDWRRNAVMKELQERKFTRTDEATLAAWGKREILYANEIRK